MAQVSWATTADEEECVFPPLRFPDAEVSPPVIVKAAAVRPRGSKDSIESDVTSPGFEKENDNETKAAPSPEASPPSPDRPDRFELSDPEMVELTRWLATGI